MQQRKETVGSQQLENLEKRVLFSTIKASDFGAITNDGKDDRAAIQKALDHAKKGDTIQFADGQYDINGHLNVGTERSLVGAPESKLVFTTGKSEFAIQLVGKTKDVTINGLIIKTNAGGILANAKTENLRIVNNDLVWGYDGNYYNRLGVRSLGGNDGLVIEHNYFHDSVHDRAVDLANITNGSYSYNTFYNIFDGGHIDGWTENFSFVGNTATKLQRMGLELQDHNGGGDNILVAYNVFTDWNQPFNESFGLSIMPQCATNVMIRDNYLSTGDAKIVRGSHYGYGIEAGFDTGNVRDNTLGGQWVTAITASMQDTRLQGNTVYGHNEWGPFTGEPGLGGHGSIDDLGKNKHEKDIGKLPKAPKVKHNHPHDDDAEAPSEVSDPKPTDSETPSQDNPESEDRTIEPTSDGSVIFLSDEKWTGAFNAWGSVELDQSVGHRGVSDGEILTLDGKQYDKGLGVGMDSSVVYELGGKFTKFFSDVGIDDAVGKKGSMTFEVWGDGKKLFESGVMRGNDATKSADLDIKGVQQLRLITTTAGDKGSNDHGDWAGVRIV